MSLTLVLVEAAILFAVAWARLLAAQGTPSDPGLVAAQALTLTSCGLLAFYFNDLYELRRVRSVRQFVAGLPQALVLMALLAGATHLLVPGLGMSWRPVAETMVVAVLVLLPLRALSHYLFAAHPFSRRVLVLGTTELAGKLVREILEEPGLRDVVVGVVDDGAGAFRPALPSLRLGSIDNLGRIVAGFEPDLIVCALDERHDPLLVRELLAPRARRVPIEDGLVAYARLTGKVAIEYAPPRAVMFSERGPSRATLLISRALSAVVAACSIVVLAPLLVPVALLIRLDSAGPVFFLHRRVGLGGRPFDLLKFRTMRPGGSTSEWAADNGHRTTSVGHWLRRFRIDELPQFLNILRGDMNLVGPRPHPVSNVELFTEHIPYYGVRCSVRPGVTGWAQVRYGYANNLAEETEKMRYDLHYITHMSLGLDLRILFETVKVVLRGGRPATLPEEPGARVAPIYFGIEHSRDGHGARPFSEPTRSWEAPPSSGSVVSLEERRARAPRASSRGDA